MNLNTQQAKDKYTYVVDSPRSQTLRTRFISEKFEKNGHFILIYVIWMWLLYRVNSLLPASLIVQSSGNFALILFPTYVRGCLFKILTISKADFRHIISSFFDDLYLIRDFFLVVDKIHTLEMALILGSARKQLTIFLWLSLCNGIKFNCIQFFRGAFGMFKS